MVVVVLLWDDGLGDVGQATHAACMECVQRADGAGKALARMHEAAAVEQREEGMMRQQELMQQLDQQVLPPPPTVPMHCYLAVHVLLPLERLF
jgi:hypothetical protein